MTNSEKRLTVWFLEQLADKYGNAGCNDLDDEVLAMLADEEKESLAKEYGPYNGDPENEYTFDRMMDFMLVGLLAHKIREEIERS